MFLLLFFLLLLLFLLVLLSLFPNGGYEMQTKWEVKRGATVRFPDMSSRFAECCTNLDPHSDMVHFFSSYISKWCLRDANEMGSQPWCYISLSRHIIQVCGMLHQSGSTFRHGALFLILHLQMVTPTCSIWSHGWGNSQFLIKQFMGN